MLADGFGFAPPLGALSTAVLFAGGLERLSRRRRTGYGHLGYDSLTALVLVGMLAVGVILASDVFGSGANIDTLLFGSLLAIGQEDLVFAATASALTLGASYLLGRAWLARGFDADAARSLGAPDAVLFVLIALVTTAALSAVGALLATALFIVPAATVRLWARRLLSRQVGSIALVAVEGMVGLWLSVQTNARPGATIAMLAGGVFALSVVLHRLVGSGSFVPN